MDAATPDAERLVTEALAKSGLLWISSPAGSSPCWHAHLAGVAYVVSGPGEQFFPDHMGRVSVIARSKESRARLASFEADAQLVSPTDADWEAATFALKAGRLNAPAEDVVARWRDSGRITRLVPDLATVVLRRQAVPGPITQAAEPSETAPTGAPNAAPSDAGVGTQAPDDRPAAAAAEREHREAVRGDVADAQATQTALAVEATSAPSPVSSPREGDVSDAQAPNSASDTTTSDSTTSDATRTPPGDGDDLDRVAR